MYCERCQVKRKVDGERFCLACRKKVVAGMKADGYLETPPKTKHERALKTNDFGELSTEELPDGSVAVRSF